MTRIGKIFTGVLMFAVLISGVHPSSRESNGTFIVHLLTDVAIFGGIAAWLTNLIARGRS